MAKITLICGDSAMLSGEADLMLTDPPFEMPGKRLAEIVARYRVQHLVLITTMRQLLEFMPHTPFELAFDFVIDGVAPKQSKSLQQPNYTHQTGVYLKRTGVKSAFNRKLRQRSDQFSAALGYWPTIIHAPREDMQTHGMAKNLAAITDIIGAFSVQSVVDPFAGRGTVGLAAAELDIDCTLIERDSEHVESARKLLHFVGNSIEVIHA